MLDNHSQNLFFIFWQSAKWHELSDHEKFSTRMHFGHWGKLRTTTPAQSPRSWCIWQITVVSRSLNTSRFPQHMLDMLDMRSYLIGWRDCRLLWRVSESLLPACRQHVIWRYMCFWCCFHHCSMGFFGHLWQCRLFSNQQFCCFRYMFTIILMLRSNWCCK